ncbi:MAG: hypothetical protein P8Y63_04975 [Deltaproteobacteria bacterium]|jgi:hypothetical protein
MERLKDFVQKDMIGQITLLEKVKEGGREETLPALLALYAEPLPNQAVDEMVYHTLFEMLATAEKQTVAALRHSSADTASCCQAGRRKRLSGGSARSYQAARYRGVRDPGRSGQSPGLLS